MKTLSTLSPEQWDEIRETFGVSKVLVWRAPTQQEVRKHQGRTVGMRLLDDGSYEVQINYDAIRCRPRSVGKDEFTLYCLYCGLAKIALGHLDQRNQLGWRKTRIRNGRRMGLKTLLAELEREASTWALDRLNRGDAERMPSLTDTEGLALAASLRTASTPVESTELHRRSLGAAASRSSPPGSWRRHAK